MAMERFGMLDGDVMFIRSMCAVNSLVVVGSSGMAMFTQLPSGVLLVRAIVGCLAIQPIDGFVRACADDIGSFIRVLDYFALVAPVVRAADAAAGLVWRRAAALRHLAQIVTEWARSKIADSQCCLGFELGLAGGEKMRTKAELGWITRTRAIASSGVALPLAAVQYNTRVLPLLWHVLLYRRHCADS